MRVSAAREIVIYIFSNIFDIQIRSILKERFIIFRARRSSRKESANLQFDYLELSNILPCRGDAAADCKYSSRILHIGLHAGTVFSLSPALDRYDIVLTIGFSSDERHIVQEIAKRLLIFSEFGNGRIVRIYFMNLILIWIFNFQQNCVLAKC
jgi:hypothetical protein